MRIPIVSAVDATTLAAQLGSVLGVPVAVSIRNPGQSDGQGSPLPGVVVLIDPKTGQELPDQDATKVAAVITAHVIPPPPKLPVRVLADALAAAASPADVKTALQAFAEKSATDIEDRQRRQHGGGGQQG